MSYADLAVVGFVAMLSILNGITWHYHRREHNARDWLAEERWSRRFEP